MNILHINKFYYLRGGVERYMFNVMKEQTNAGHTVIPFSVHHPQNQKTKFSKYFLSNTNAKGSIAELNALKKVGRVLYSFEARNAIARLLDDHKVDIAHVHSIYHHISPSILSELKKRGIPIVMSVHDYKLICPNYRLFTNNDVCTRCKGHKYYNAVGFKCLKDSYAASTLASVEMYFHTFMKFYEKYIDRFIVPSQCVYDKLVEFGQDESKIQLLPHFYEPLSEGKKMRKIPNISDKYILYFGRLDYVKGVDVLLEMMYNLKSSVHLVIAGDGPEKRQILAKIDELKLNKKVFLIGHLQGQDLSHVIEDSLFTLMPSRWWEPFGLTLLESFAHGKPVIGSRMGAIPEIIEEGKSGLLFENENAQELLKCVEKLLADANLREKMGRYAMKRVQTKYAAEKYMKKLESIYTKVNK